MSGGGSTYKAYVIFFWQLVETMSEEDAMLQTITVHHDIVKIELKYYSVTYFEHITKFDAL